MFRPTEIISRVRREIGAVRDHLSGPIATAALGGSMVLLVLGVILLLIIRLLLCFQAQTP